MLTDIYGKCKAPCSDDLLKVYCIWTSELQQRDSPVLWKPSLTSLIFPLGSRGHMWPCWLHCGCAGVSLSLLLGGLSGLMVHLHEGGAETRYGRRPAPSHSLSHLKHTDLKESRSLEYCMSNHSPVERAHCVRLGGGRTREFGTT